MEKKATSAGDAFAERMKAEYSSNVDDRHVLEEARVAAAQAAVLKQLLKLKGHLKGKGKRAAADGKIHMLFGELFEAVQGDMPTLSGTLITARRLGIVAFDGETLFQGASNKVDITLLDESDKSDYVVAVRAKGKHGKDEERDPFAFDAKATKIENCARCSKPVLGQGNVLLVCCFLTSSFKGSLLTEWACLTEFCIRLVLNAIWTRAQSS